MKEELNIEQLIAENEENCRLFEKAMNGKARDVIIYLQKYRPEVWGTGYYDGNK